MKILIVSQHGNAFTPCPKKRISAPSVLLYNLAKGLRKKGHQVKVYTAADSKKGDFAIEDMGIKSTYFYRNFDEKACSYRINQHELYAISSAFEEFAKGNHDLLVLDSFVRASYFTNFVKGPILAIHHGIPQQNHDLKFDLDYLRQKRYFNRIKFIAISRKQKDLGKKYFNYFTVIHHGIDLNLFKFNPKGDKNFLYAGRLREYKQPDLAIKVIIAADQKINLIGDTDKTREDKYWIEILEPLIKKCQKKVNFIGYVPYCEMEKYYAKAKALIFPIDWEEPFGLVMIEAMACGTPVIAFRRGAVPEVIVDGKTGFICPPNDFQCMVKAVKKIAAMPEKEYLTMRKNCREHVEKHFSLERMVDDYEKVFLKIIKDWKKKKD